MSIRAVLLDIGNTLLEYSLDGQWRQFLVRRLEEMHPVVRDLVGPIAITAPDFAARVGEVIGGQRARDIERRGRSWHFAQRLREGLGTVGLCADAEVLDRLTEVFYEPIRECTKPYSDTREVLDALRSLGIRLAIITNSPWDTPARLLRGDLERWSIGEFFNAFICSGEVPWRKPNPAFMLAAAEAVKARPEECLVVGDKLEADIAGAVAAGMQSVWMNRAGSTVSSDARQPDWVVGTLTEVLEILEGSVK